MEEYLDTSGEMQISLMQGANSRHRLIYFNDHKKEKMSFTLQHGVFRFIRVLFNMENASSKFQKYDGHYVCDDKLAARALVLGRYIHLSEIRRGASESNMGSSRSMVGNREFLEIEGVILFQEQYRKPWESNSVWRAQGLDGSCQSDMMTTISYKPS